MTAGIGFIISLALTLLIFSYLLGDNILFRLAVSAFVGLAAAFTTIVTIQSVLLPLTKSGGLNALLFVVGGILALLLLIKPIRQLRVLSNISLGFLIAVGSAAAVVGAVSGTLIPIVSQTAEVDFDNGLMPMISSLILVIGVITSLLYFNYGARQNSQGEIERGVIMKTVATIGQGFIVVTLGALYGAAILTSLTILTGQLEMLFGS
ncbi:MAG: hypothetical protein Phog2KO_41690 [Phototrophicaceae bacterium]